MKIYKVSFSNGANDEYYGEFLNADLRVKALGYVEYGEVNGAHAYKITEKSSIVGTITVTARIEPVEVI